LAGNTVAPDGDNADLSRHICRMFRAGSPGYIYPARMAKCRQSAAVWRLAGLFAGTAFYYACLLCA
ncbi:hypothetical protein, partial [Serratia marcescens]|uniref:hypothetical protein n=1 Tax=Serratia marcescens TaxID=615 RepID=UPI00217E97B3